MYSVLKIFGILWASPWTLLGLGIGILCLPFSGNISLYRGTIGCYGKGIAVLLRRVPIWGGARAMTLGHTILACDRVAFFATHSHEMVHVRQYARWGPIFVPAYLLCSIWLWLTGRDPYMDNPFEIQAYQLESEANSRHIA